ncbi:MAG: hypothetical protein AAGF01_03710 [Cyanobacteria bacterium P01_G01_bin.38]
MRPIQKRQEQKRPRVVRSSQALPECRTVSSGAVGDHPDCDSETQWVK